MLPAPPLPADVDPDAARRIRKRINGFLAVRRSPEYSNALRLWFLGHIEQMPDEPNPVDMTLSKRAWESSVQRWRNALRRTAPAQ